MTDSDTRSDILMRLLESLREDPRLEDDARNCPGNTLAGGAMWIVYPTSSRRGIEDLVEEAIQILDRERPKGSGMG